MLDRKQRSDSELTRAAESTTLVVSPEQEPLFPPLPPTAGGAMRKKRWPYFLAAGSLIVAAGVGSLILYSFTRGPSLEAFEEGFTASAALASTLQRETDALNGPEDLVAYRGSLLSHEADVARVEMAAIGVPQARHRAALVALVGSEQNYLAELQRLANLAPETALLGQFGRVRELANASESAYASSQMLLSSTTNSPLNLSPAALERVLSERRTAFKNYEAALTKARAENRRRAAELATVGAFTGRLDGIITRYSRSRTELSNWIDEVNRFGASFGEAYQVLDQQAERRRQLRNELAALPAPAAFTAHVSGLLAVIDQAVDATDAAARGISEYQYSSYYEYSSYDETPGWLSFEQTSGEISRSYGAALDRYQQAKLAITTKLQKKVPMPRRPT